MFHHTKVPKAVERLVLERQASNVGLDAAGVTGLVQGHAEGTGGEVEREEGLIGFGTDAATGFGRAAATFDVDAGSCEVTGDVPGDAARADLPAVEREESSAQGSRQSLPVAVPFIGFGAGDIRVQEAGLAVVFRELTGGACFVAQQFSPVGQ